MLIRRKEFLQLGSLATGSLFIPGFLKAFERPAVVPKGNKVAVVIQLSGGNDGLNTVIPYRNDLYYKGRPSLGIRRETALSLGDEAGLHPSLPHVKSLFDAGELGILNSVGYPNPDRSHFRSMDIWHTASPADQVWQQGWIGRYLDAQCTGCDRPVRALEVDDVLSLAMKGQEEKGMAFRNARDLFGNTQEPYFRALLKEHHDGEHGLADYLYKTMADTMSSADKIFKESKRHQTAASYPGTQLGQGLKTIASLIFSDIETRVYYISLGSFDTHVNQNGQQGRLFTELNDALRSFTNDLKANHRFEDVLIFTFSEFGRRVSQNASGGTDHGAANNMLLISGGLKEQGLLNALPDLGDLREGDLKHTVDFKQVYATVLDKWLGADDQAILKGRYEKLGFV